MKKIIFAVLLLVFGMGFSGCESMQQTVTNIKADVVGTKRHVILVSYTGEIVKEYTDDDMRYESEGRDRTAFWLGSKNMKVTTTLPFIVEDVE
jgi:hypothetical protein